MISKELEIYEVDVDGPPELPGDYYCWLEVGDVVKISITESMIESFEDNFENDTWVIDGESVIGYVEEDELDPLTL